METKKRFSPKVQKKKLLSKHQKKNFFGFYLTLAIGFMFERQSIILKKFDDSWTNMLIF